MNKNDHYKEASGKVFMKMEGDDEQRSAALVCVENLVEVVIDPSPVLHLDDLGLGEHHQG